tara:strand:+ start:285 stop:521 length:237 start_codon:yes stop_codon:yes gene_type:complete
MDIKNIKKDFPIFKQQINGKPLVYLDSANSSQKPKVVIDRISHFYETEFSNVGRSVHALLRLKPQIVLRQQEIKFKNI